MKRARSVILAIAVLLLGLMVSTPAAAVPDPPADGDDGVGVYVGELTPQQMDELLKSGVEREAGRHPRGARPPRVPPTSSTQPPPARRATLTPPPPQVDCTEMSFLQRDVDIPPLNLEALRKCNRHMPVTRSPGLRREPITSLSSSQGRDACSDVIANNSLRFR